MVLLLFLLVGMLRRWRRRRRCRGMVVVMMMIMNCHRLHVHDVVLRMLVDQHHWVVNRIFVLLHVLWLLWLLLFQSVVAM
jgi:hypothetical protein